MSEFIFTLTRDDRTVDDDGFLIELNQKAAEKWDSRRTPGRRSA